MSTARTLFAKPFHLALLILALGAGTGLIVSAGAPQAPVDPGIRFVDMHKVMVNTKFFQQGLTGIKKYMSEQSAKMKALEEGYNKKKASLKDMKPRTKLAIQTGAELVQLKAQMDYLRKVTRATSTNDTARLEMAVYIEVRKTINEYAKAKGIKAVLQVDEKRHLQKEKLGIESTLQANSLRSVLWHHPMMEITDDIIKMMNNG